MARIQTIECSSSSLFVLYLWGHQGDHRRTSDFFWVIEPTKANELNTKGISGIAVKGEKILFKQCEEG
jgi:hypothetical protein